jgi:tetratricopeptide (TPR) repeat protein
MRKFILVLLAIATVIAIVYVAKIKSTCPFLKRQKKLTCIEPEKAPSLKEAFSLLKARKDKQALVIFEKILSRQPDNLDALWGKGEVLRRIYRFKEAEEIFQQVLQKDPQYASALVSLSYFKYREDKLDEGLKLLNQALKSGSLNKENQAIAYTLLGAINAKRSGQGWFWNKIIYGTQIKGYFEKAMALDPSLPEVHLGLGTFYLKAPAIAGGNLDKAIAELELALKMAPDFATPQVRLAQAYKKKGDLQKAEFYLKQAKQLDPQNEALKDAE